MNHNDNGPISDEILNAYVDGELGPEECRRIESAMDSDERVRAKVDELNRLKQLVQGAYEDERPAKGQRPAPRSWSVGALAASVAAFTLGVLLTWGWFSYGPGGMAGQPVAGVAGQNDVAATPARSVKVLFHVSRADPERLNTILNEAEALLSTTRRREGQVATVRIVATGAGLSLFEQGSAPAGERIRSMKNDYRDQLVFNGCGLAYKQLKQRRSDGELKLLPEVKLVDLGVLELTRRQRAGWTYVRL